MSKEKIRNRLKQARWTIPPIERELMSREICNRLAGMIETKETVLVYCAKEPEVETCWLIDSLLSLNIRVVVPIIEQKSISLRLSYIDTRDVLCPSTFSVPEPVGKEIPARKEDITSVILPVLGFDRNGGRIGYGAGYYDRFLSNNSHIKKIGLAYSNQEESKIPLQDHDIRMDMIVTEKDVFMCNW